MGRPVRVTSAGAMYLVLCCCWVYVCVSPLAASAQDIDGKFYADADEAIMKRIQQVLMEWRQKQLRILQNNQEHETPQFTFHFPEEPTQNSQNEYFAVPPSDPRYYQPEEKILPDEEKRLDNDNSNERLSKPDVSQIGTPIPTEENLSDDITSEANDPQVEKADTVSVFKKLLPKDEQDIVLVAIIAGCGAAAAAAVVALSVGWYKLHTSSKAAADIEYPAYGVTGPNKEITPTGDRRLAQSAQMYHYQHQKQQIIAMESNRANNERRGSVSEGDSDEENEEGDYTVYECPGLAATGELEVKNPLFLDDPTPATGNHTAEEPPAPADKK